MGKRKIGDTEQHGDSPLSVRLSYKHRQRIQELALLLGSDQSGVIRQAVDALYVAKMTEKSS